MRRVKTLLSLLAILFFHAGAFALVPSTTVTEKSSVVQDQSVSSNDASFRKQQMEFFANLSLKDYETFSGKKLNFFERLAFKVSQHRAKQALKKEDGSVNTLSKISWFVKGLILGPIALLIGYLFLKDDERELLKWIWFGTIGFAIILTIILVSL